MERFDVAHAIQLSCQTLYRIHIIQQRENIIIIVRALFKKMQLKDDYDRSELRIILLANIRTVSLRRSQ